MKNVTWVLWALAACQVGEKFLELPNDKQLLGRGNEPGWSVNIHNNRRITFINNYGADTMLLNANDPTCTYTEYSVGGIKAQRLYFTKQNLIIDIKEMTCTDDMSGQKSDYSVHVTHNNTKLIGCGWLVDDDK